MANQLIAAITLAKNYGPSSINNTQFSVLTNWNLLIGTLGYQNATNIGFDTIVTGFAALDSPTISPAVTIGNGIDFTLTFQLVNSNSGDATIAISLSRFGTNLPGDQQPLSQVCPGLSITPMTFNFNPGGFEFDKIQVIIVPTTHDGGWDFSAPVIATNNGTYSDFNTGDRIIIYWDDTVIPTSTGSINGIVVYREDNPGGALTLLSSGPNLGDLDVRAQFNNVDIPRDPTNFFDKFSMKSFYQFCNGTDLIEFPFTGSSPDYPYTFVYRSVSNSVCVVQTIVCDVAFVAVPVINQASSKFLNDGAVFISAGGSHGVVRYSTRPPTTFSGQFSQLTNTSGIFTDLYPGIYTFYAVDQYNCFASVNVVIGFTNLTAYGPKYRLRYNDEQLGVQTIADIEERAFTGDPIFAMGTGDPIVISKNNGELNNKFEVIRPTFAEVNINSETHFQYLGLFSQDDRKYRLNFSHNGYTWKGFLIPSTYIESYSPSKNYPISLKFGDTLANLSEFDFLDDSGNPIFGDHNLLEIIVIILNKLDLKLDIITGINKFAAGMSTAFNNDNPLLQTYIECICFYDDAGTPMKCDEVLQAILKPFGAYVIQNGSAWNILEVDGQTAPFRAIRYDYSGAYTGDSIVDPIIDISRPFVTLEDVLFANSDHTLEIMPAYGKITINHILKPRKSIFPLSLDQWQKNANGGGVISPFPISGSIFKGVQITSLNAGQASLISPFFSVKSNSDAVLLSFKYLYSMVRYATFTDPVTGITFNSQNVPDPPWTRITWRLLLQYSGVDFYFNEFLGWTRLDVVSTSSSSVVTPSSHPSSRSLTISPGLTLPPGTTLKIYHDITHYFRATVTTYDVSSGALVCSSFANVGTGTFTSWSIYASGIEYTYNYIFVTEYNGDFLSFDKQINLPPFPTLGGATINLQLQLIFQGDYYKDFTDLTTIHAIPSSVYPAGFQISGSDPTESRYLKWYKLRQGTDSESSPSIIRGSDFNSNSNAVVWEATDIGYPYVNQIASIRVQEATVEFLPGKQKPGELETLIYNNNPNYKENLEYELICGDSPNIQGSKIYTNIFKLIDGTPTFSWSRRDIAETGTIQTLLLKSLGNQYNKPTWRLSGSWLGPNIEFTNIYRHTINQIPFSITNPENPGDTGWSQSGSGQSWQPFLVAGSDTVEFDPSHTGNSTYQKQPSTLISGSRIRIDFSLRRLNTSGIRIDRFVCVLFQGASIVQKVTLSDGLQADNDIFQAIAFNIDTDADTIGFFIENISGTGTCRYEVDYFRGNGVSSVRYYYANQISRSDKHNLYKAELIQLIPATASTDPSIDDTGGGNTGGNDSGGGVNGKAFSYGFSTGFS